MKIKETNMELELHKMEYNKTKVQEDGITHIVDTSVDYPMYYMQLSKSYFDIDKYEEVALKIANDLRNTAKYLEDMVLTKRKGKEPEEEVR